MTLEQRRDGTRLVSILVECPFCGYDLRGKSPPFHLQKCPEAPREVQS